VPVDARRQVVRRGEEGRQIDPVRLVAAGLIAVRPGTLGAAPEQGHGAAGVPPVRVGQADGDLGEPLPQVALAGPCGLPRRLEDLMGVERAARAQQLAGQPGRVRPGKREVLGHLRLAALAAAQRPSQPVTRARVPRPAGVIAVPSHRSGSGSASQPRSSVPKASGRSSCGKCPAPSITCHR
jgi:hypothetical protein